MTLRESLEEIYARHGALTPQIVVDTARDAADDDPAAQLLRGRLEWDDAVAGEAHRREQAGELIRSVRVVYKPASDGKDERSVRAFHSVRTEQGCTFQPLERVVADDFTRRLVLADMEREWKALKDRWGHFKEFSTIVSADVEQVAA